MKTKERADRPNQFVGSTQRERAIAGSGRIEKINQLFFFDRRGHGDLRQVEAGKAAADAAPARDRSGDAKAQAIRALVTNHLQRRARHATALQLWGTVVVQQTARKRGEETAHRRT